MSPFWYVADLGLIAASFALARFARIREFRSERLAIQGARDRVQRIFDGGACQSYERMEAIGRRLSDLLGAHGGTHQFTMAQLDRTLHDANRAYLQLGDTISDSGSATAQLQADLAEFCRKYSELVLLLGDVAQQSGHDIAPDESFRAWMRYDQTFARELGRLTVEPEFLPLARAVRAFFTKDGFTASQSLKGVVSHDNIESLMTASAPLLDEMPIQIRASERLQPHRAIH